MLFVGCTIPLASVKTRQSLPLALPKGCYYADGGGIGDSGNYLYVNGFAYDAGTFFMQVAQGNALITMACSDAAMQASYGDMYKQYMLANFQGQGDGKLRDDLENTKKAVSELSDNVVDLAKLAASQPAGSPAPGKPINVAPAPQVAMSSPAPVSAPAPAPINPAVIGQLQSANGNIELVNVLRAAAQADPANATMFNSLAIKVGATPESEFKTNQTTLVNALR